MTAPGEVSIDTPMGAAAQIEEPMQLALSKNVHLGNFTGMTTVQVQAMTLVDPTAEPARPVVTATLQRTAPKDLPAPATPKAQHAQPGIAGRAWNAFTAAVKGIFRAVSQRLAAPAAMPVSNDSQHRGVRRAGRVRELPGRS